MVYGHKARKRSSHGGYSTVINLHFCPEMKARKKHCDALLVVSLVLFMAWQLYASTWWLSDSTQQSQFDSVIGSFLGDQTARRSMLAIPKERAFGACLMVKNDNDLLHEWIAYHYTVLPLRYLIVGKDVNNTEEPMDVLKPWKDQAHLDFWILNSSEFSYRFEDSERKVEDAKVRHHHSLVNRQKGFISTCSLILKENGVRWTAYIDTDEYVLPNLLSQNDEPFHAAQRRRPTLNSSLEIRSTLQNVGHPNSSVAQTLLNLQIMGRVKSCFTLPRLLVGALKNRTCKEARTVASETNLVSSLYTLRYTQHAPKGDFKHSKFGKVFIDLQSIPSDVLSNVKPRNIHRPYSQFCGHSLVHFPNSIFYINHYIGSWKRYNARPDERRNRQEWEQRAFLDDGSPSCESQIHTWLPRFISVVGNETAKQLLQKVPKL